MGAAMQADVLAALGDDAKFFVENANGRLHCTLTNIDLLPDADSVTAHLHSKRFKAAKVEAGLKQFGPYIVTSPEYPDKLQCTLTGVLINKNEDAVWKHIMGKKFQRRLGEKEAEKAAKKGNSNPPGPSKQEAAKTNPPEPSPMVPEAKPEASSSSEEEDDDEEGGFWIPPPGSRRDEDREEETAAGGEDVVMEEPDDIGGANGHASSLKEANGGGKRKSKSSKGTASSNGDKRTTRSLGPAENAPQKKKRRPQG